MGKITSTKGTVVVKADLAELLGETVYILADGVKHRVTVGQVIDYAARNIINRKAPHLLVDFDVVVVEGHGETSVTLIPSTER